MKALNPWQIGAALAGCGSVALGAIAAHGMADPLAAASLERAATLGLIHALLLLLVGGWAGRAAWVARVLIALGLVLFTGGIALKYLVDIDLHSAPLGGVSLMFGWLLLALAKRA